MATYLIGDVHGCYRELLALLKKVKFSPKEDILWLTGDLIARGPDSLKVLRYLKSLGDRLRIVLGNHDLHLLKAYISTHYNRRKDYFTNLLLAPDIDLLINWLRCQPLLQIDEEKRLIMTHAGISPQWNLNTTKECANYVETILAGDFYPFFLCAMYGDTPNNWSQKLNRIERFRFIINVFTRMRYCFPDGKLDLYHKDTLDNASFLLKPWFNIPNQITKEYDIVFGHWASLRGRNTPKGIYALDTGCCWGGMLTCLRWSDKKFFVQPCYGNSHIIKENS